MFHAEAGGLAVIGRGDNDDRNSWKSGPQQRQCSATIDSRDSQIQQYEVSTRKLRQPFEHGFGVTGLFDLCVGENLRDQRRNPLTVNRVVVDDLNLHSSGIGSNPFGLPLRGKSGAQRGRTHRVCTATGPDAPAPGRRTSSRVSPVMRIAGNFRSNFWRTICATLSPFLMRPERQPAITASGAANVVTNESRTASALL